MAGTGGRREGAGRKKGSHNTKTKNRMKIADEALKNGKTPLEIMLETMRELYEKAQTCLDETTKKDEKAKAESAKMRIGFLREACEIAKDAAPYVHSKLANVNMNTTINMLDTLSERLKEARDRAAAKQQ